MCLFFDLRFLFLRVEGFAHVSLFWCKVCLLVLDIHGVVRMYEIVSEIAIMSVLCVASSWDPA